MTRVEKYRTYREEIANMKIESFSSKKVVSQRIERICNDNESSKLGYDEVLKVFDVYDSDAKKVKKHINLRLKKSQIIYLLVATIVIVGLLIGVIVTGLKL